MARPAEFLEARDNAITNAIAAAADRLGGGDGSNPEKPDEEEGFEAADPEPEESDVDDVAEFYGDREPASEEPQVTAAPEETPPAADPAETPAAPSLQERMLRIQEAQFEAFQQEQARRAEAMQAAQEAEEAKRAAQFNDPEWRLQEMLRIGLVDEGASVDELARAGLVLDGQLRLSQAMDRIAQLEAKQQALVAQAQGYALRQQGSDLARTMIADYDLSTKVATHLEQRAQAMLQAGYTADHVKAELDIFLDGRAKKAAPKSQPKAQPPGAPSRTPEQLRTLRNASAGSRGTAPQTRQENKNPRDVARARMDAALGRLSGIG